MVVTTHCEAWIVLADHYQARLLGCTTTPTGRCHLTEYGSTESPIPDITFDKPSAVSGTAGHSYAERRRRLEEEYRRFARQLGRWMSECIERFDIEHLTVFAPESSHTHVRSHLRKAHRDRVAFRGENLLQLSQDALCRHHLITSLRHAPHRKQTV